MVDVDDRRGVAARSPRISKTPMFPFAAAPSIRAGDSNGAAGIDGLPAKSSLGTCPHRSRWRLGLGLSIAAHLVALVGASQWAFREFRWAFEVERGKSATMILTASMAAPPLPPVEFSEMLALEPPHIEPPQAVLAEPKNQRRPAVSRDSSRLTPLPEPNIPSLATDQQASIRRRADHDPPMPSVTRAASRTLPRRKIKVPPPIANAVTPPVAASNDQAGAEMDTPPRKLPRNPPPEYPVNARRAGQEGRVVLLASIDSSGRVMDVAIAISCGYPALDEAAIRTVSTWKFQPALSAGRPTATEVRVPVRFSLRSSR